MKRFWWGLLIGAPVGMILADARRSGRGVRQVTADWAGHAQSRIGEVKETLRQQAPDLVERAGRVMNAVADSMERGEGGESQRNKAEARQSSDTATESAFLRRPRPITDAPPATHTEPVARATGTCALNYISRDELISVYGIGPVIADRIIQHRPYKRDEEVAERGILPRPAWAALEYALRKRTA